MADTLAARHAHIRRLARQLFGPYDGKAWLTKSFEGSTPLELMKTEEGAKRVEAYLEQLEDSAS